MITNDSCAIGLLKKLTTAVKSGDGKEVDEAMLSASHFFETLNMSYEEKVAWLKRDGVALNNPYNCICESVKVPKMEEVEIKPFNEDVLPPLISDAVAEARLFGLGPDEDLNGYLDKVIGVDKPKDTVNEKLTSTELSSIVYLLDALTGAPTKAEKLLSIADKPDGSLAYKNIMERLIVAVNIDKREKGISGNLFAEIAKIRVGVL